MSAHAPWPIEPDEPEPASHEEPSDHGLCGCAKCRGFRLIYIERPGTREPVACAVYGWLL